MLYNVYQWFKLSLMPPLGYKLPFKVYIAFTHRWGVTQFGIPNIVCLKILPVVDNRPNIGFYYHYNNFTRIRYLINVRMLGVIYHWNSIPVYLNNYILHVNILRYWKTLVVFYRGILRVILFLWSLRYYFTVLFCT